MTTRGRNSQEYPDDLQPVLVGVLHPSIGQIERASALHAQNPTGGLSLCRPLARREPRVPASPRVRSRMPVSRPSERASSAACRRRSAPHHRDVLRWQECRSGWLRPRFAFLPSRLASGVLSQERSSRWCCFHPTSRPWYATSETVPVTVTLAVVQFGEVGCAVDVHLAALTHIHLVQSFNIRDAGQVPDTWVYGGRVQQR